MKESRDQVIDTATALWKLCKPDGTRCRNTHCAAPAETRGDRGQHTFPLAGKKHR